VNGENTKCRRKLANTTRRHKNIIPTLLVIMVKQRSTTKLDNTRKRLTMPIWRGRTQFTLEFTLKRRPKRTTKSTAINNSLSASQFEQFNAKAHFDVVGCATGRRYRIHYGTQANVHELDDEGCLKMGWCFVPQGRLVPGDVMLAQKIALETSESRALSVAIRFAPNRKVRDDRLALIRQVLSGTATGRNGGCCRQ
jgi:hypothetical protein